MDSHEAARATAKERSSAKALTPLLRKIMAVSLAFHLMLAVHLLPTRLKVADDPTRDADVRPAAAGTPWYESMIEEEIIKAAEMPTLKRWAGNWISLCRGLLSRHHLRFASLSLPCHRQNSVLPPACLYQHRLDSDSSLGFPGAGPKCSSLFFVVWILISVRISAVSHANLVRNKNDVARAAKRMGRPLQSGQPVEQVTRTN